MWKIHITLAAIPFLFVCKICIHPSCFVHHIKSPEREYIVVLQHFVFLLELMSALHQLLRNEHSQLLPHLHRTITRHCYICKIAVQVNAPTPSSRSRITRADSNIFHIFLQIIISMLLNDLFSNTLMHTKECVN